MPVPSENYVGTAMFGEVCDLLHAGHGKGSPTPEHTLNRLFRKHLGEHKKEIAKDPPWLSDANTRVTLESWSKPKLHELAPRAESRPPRFDNFPVVIVRYRGRDCVIDGGSRIHAWHKAGDNSTHPAYVLTVGAG